MNNATKKENNGINSTVKLVICALLVFISTMAYSPTSGVLRTLPLLFLGALVSSLIKTKASLVLSLTGTFCLVIYLVFGAGVWQSVIFTLLALFQAGCGLYFSALLTIRRKTEKKKTKSKCLLLCFLDVVVCFIVTGMFCGNAVSFVANKNENVDYIKKNYENEIKIKHTAYSFKDARYLTYVSFVDDSYIIGDKNDCFVSHSKSRELLDNVRDYYEEKMLKEAKLDFSKLISNSTGAFEVMCAQIDFEDGEILDAGSDYRDYADRVSYVVAFYSIIEKEDSFKNLCFDVLKTLENEKYDFENIVFCAGKSDEILFSMSVDEKTEKTGVFDISVKFDEKVLSRYGVSEEDVLDYWKNE